jgi:hypothetical protein
MNNLLAESRWRKGKAVEEIRKPLKKIFSDFSEIGKPLKKAESCWRKQKAVEEIGKPLKKIFSNFSEIRKPLKKIEFCVRKIGV